MYDCVRFFSNLNYFSYFVIIVIVVIKDACFYYIYFFGFLISLFVILARAEIFNVKIKSTKLFVKYCITCARVVYLIFLLQEKKKSL